MRKRGNVLEREGRCPGLHVRAEEKMSVFRSFYRAPNAIFGRVGRIASEGFTSEVNQMYTNLAIRPRSLPVEEN